MTLAEQVQTLRTGLPKLDTGSQSFAASLIRSYDQFGRLTSGQAPWIGKLLQRLEPRPTVSLGDFQGVISLFATAKAKLKWPKITLDLNGTAIVLSVAGERSRNPGSINVAGKGAFGNRAWYGRISPQGEWTPATRLDGLEDLLRQLATDPAATAKRYGQLTGNCSFCTRPLSDPRSTAAGFGPVCAENYGLTEQWKTAAGTGAKAPEPEQLDLLVAA